MPYAALLPIMATVFTVYLVIGLAMPVLPLQIQKALGFGPFMVGIVSGSQFAAAMLLRIWAGNHVDTRGARHALVVGLGVAVLSGLLYYLSSLTAASPNRSVAWLMAGRVLLGAAESFVITGALALGITASGPGNTGIVMSWVGTALYAAYAIGAPIGSVVYGKSGFHAIAATAAVFPLLGLWLVRFIKSSPVRSAKSRGSFAEVGRAVWLPGLGVALSGVGFGAITTFIVLLYSANHWTPTWLPFTALGASFIAGRLLFGRLPDRLGGAKVALVCIVIEIVGQLLIWLSAHPGPTLAGVILTGLGYSLVYPAFGVEALRRVPDHRHGVAMGAFTAFLDLSLGVTGPALGWIAAHAGLNNAFLASALCASVAGAIALTMMSGAALAGTPVSTSL